LAKPSFVSAETPFLIFDHLSHSRLSFTALVADPLLVWNYGVVGCLSFAGFIGFWWSTRNLDAQEDKLNAISQGHVDRDHPVADVAEDHSEHAKH
jgi:POT family proton-dependent oligopeptide transporter